MMKKVLAIILGLFIILAAVGCGAPKAKYSLKQYNQLSDGMTHGQAMRILGDQGVSTGESVMPGVPGVMEKIKTETFTWKNEDGSNMIVMFQNDKLIMKSQFGLK